VVSDEYAAADALTPSPARGEEFRGRRVAFNSMAMMIGQVVFTAIGLVTTPVTLSHIGLVEFGLWGIIFSAVGYITLLDPGFGDLITRYGARAHLEGNRALAARLCSLFTLVWLGLGAIGLPLLFWLVPKWVPYLHLSPGLNSVAIRFFYWGYLITIAGCVAAILSARLTAIGDQWLVTVIDAVTRVIYCVVLIVLLFSGFKLSALVIALSVQLGLTFIATIAFVIRRAGGPYGNPLRLHGDVVRETLRFGGWLQLGGLLEVLTYETDPLVIGTFVSVRRAGTYNIGQRVARQSTYFAFIAQSSILSAVSAAYAAKEGLHAMRRMYVRANRLVVLLGCIIGGAVLGTAPVIIAAWLGRSYAYADLATCLAVVALMLGLPRPAVAAVIMAMGRVGLGVRAQAAAFAINLVLTLALVKPLGMFGVMLATVIAKLAATGYLLARFHRLVQSTARELLLSWLVKVLLAVSLAAGACRLILLYLPVSVVHDRLPALAALALLGVVYVLVFGVVLRVTRYFGTDDLAWFAEILPAPLARIAASSIVHRIVGATT
jgi:O-antigen/teichoic acid export membrane protein